MSSADAAETHRSIDRGFEAMSEIHRLMSFHEPASELSCLNREAATAPVPVDSRTLEVIALAVEVAAASAGRFDPTIAAQARPSAIRPLVWRLR